MSTTNEKHDALAERQKQIGLLATLTIGISTTRLNIASLKSDISALGPSEEEERARLAINEALAHLGETLTLLTAARGEAMMVEIQRRAR